MTSAALDACLCVLLISAAAVTVTSIPQPSAESTDDRADAVAETLAAETAELSYTLRPLDREPDAAGSEYDRIAHGTLASLLATAAVRTVHVGGDPLTKTNNGFTASIRETVRTRLPARAQVVVEFRPYPGAHLGRKLTVGPTPPATADVHAATVRAASGVSTVENPESVAQTEGFDGLGNAVAGVLVDGLFPPEKGRLALAGGSPVDRLIEHRYARASDRYTVETRDAVERGDTATANTQLTDAMADRVASDLREEFDSPTAAAESLRLSEVTIGVRTWST
ncbi:hypothetical protein [Halolamina sp.]|jgi:hypothetical protein|uniref:DUF7284 family protein n=1 Tax=Halolamina sp. TaxID=1940283 RepID=UPI000223B818|nr:hypothetical protein Halar_0777 [halophilic archaeon DL31]